ncbi:MAG TPA: GAF domain-containing protein [Pyrinomonadaceae bacterium]|nr:GAF domain-containing protein [Pyrinomonadaceae bacterium]
MVNGHLEDSLRREIESYLESRLSAVKQEITTLQSLLNESLTTFLERQGDVQMEGSLVAAITEHLHAAHERGVELAASESARAKASSDMAIVKAAIAEINEQKSQADILKALVNRASSFAPRVAFFVIKGEQATGWRARGFEGTVGDDAIQQISMPLSADTVVGSAARGRATWSGGPGSHSEDHLLLNRLGEEPAQRIVAIPLNARGRAVAVLYADSAGLDSESINLEALETLVTVAAMAVELLSAARTTPKRTAEQPAAPAPAPVQEEPAYQPASEYVAPAPAEVEPAYTAADTYHTYEPEPAPVEPETLVEAIPVDEPSGVFEDGQPQDRYEEPSFAQTGNEYAEPETVPYYQQEEQQFQHEPPQQQRKRYGQDAELPVEVSGEEERKLHNYARRFARLLISEIKLYNEQKVAEGRSEHDLYDRLREYIDRSREMYDKRVKPEVANRYDYFHDELVNTLAEGDVSKLGSNYPGATVNA